MLAIIDFAANDNNNNGDNNNNNNNILSKFKEKITRQTEDVEIMVPLKCLSNH